MGGQGRSLLHDRGEWERGVEGLEEASLCWKLLPQFVNLPYITTTKLYSQKFGDSYGSLTVIGVGPMYSSLPFNYIQNHTFATSLINLSFFTTCLFTPIIDTISPCTILTNTAEKYFTRPNCYNILLKRYRYALQLVLAIWVGNSILGQYNKRLFL